MSQALAWIERAEAGGLIERAMDDEPARRPAVRLTEAGMELARNNRRSGGRTRSSDSPDAARAPHS